MAKNDKKELTVKQEAFCQVYATDRDCFGNGTQAYIKVYDSKKHPVTYKSARQLAYMLLTNVDITARIRELIDVYLSEEVVDKEMASVVLQSGDLGAKMAAIREFNKLKGRLADDKSTVTHQLDFTPEQLNEFIRRRTGGSGADNRSEGKAD